MLQKNPPSWSISQDKAIAAIKSVVPSLPALQIPSTGKRILQTDASDSHWAAVLLEELNDNQHVCGYKSGSFSSSEELYHSTHKEVLAVKRGIERFEFHLVGHHFIVEMDMSCFPRMLDFKQKTIPNSQRLRWQQWFANYDFEVKHIKGKDNVIADLLSRPIIKRQLPSSIFIALSKAQTTILVFFIMSFQPIRDIPPEVPEEFHNNTLGRSAEGLLWHYHSQSIKEHGLHVLGGLDFHPHYPFLHLFNWDPSSEISINILHMLWFLLNHYDIAIQFPVLATKEHLDHWLTTHNNRSILIMFLEWFHPLSWWQAKFSSYLAQNWISQFHPTTLIMNSPSQQ